MPDSMLSLATPWVPQLRRAEVPRRSASWPDAAYAMGQQAGCEGPELALRAPRGTIEAVDGLVGTGFRSFVSCSAARATIGDGRGAQAVAGPDESPYLRNRERGLQLEECRLVREQGYTAFLANLAEREVLARAERSPPTGGARCPSCTPRSPVGSTER